VAKIAVGDLTGIREDENGDSRNWGTSGNKKIHGWEFARFARLLEYKAEEYGILIDRVDEANTSKTCETVIAWSAGCTSVRRVRRR
jgi:putative transposase